MKTRQRGRKSQRRRNRKRKSREGISGLASVNAYSVFEELGKFEFVTYIAGLATIAAAMVGAIIRNSNKDRHLVLCLPSHLDLPIIGLPNFNSTNDIWERINLITA